MFSTDDTEYDAVLLNASLPLLHNTNPTLCGFFLAGTFWLNLFHWLVAVLIPGPKMWPCSKPRTMSGDESSGNVTESSICIASRNNRGIPTAVFVRENKAKKKTYCTIPAFITCCGHRTTQTWDIGAKEQRVNATLAPSVCSKPSYISSTPAL